MGGFTRDVLKRAALFPQHQVIGRSFGRDRVGMVDMTNWTLPESHEGAAASLYLEIFNTATGPNRDGVGAHDLAACIQNGWVDLTRYRFIAIPEEWAAALLHDKCAVDFRGSESALHRELKWNAAGLLFLAGVPDIHMEWDAPYGKRVDVGSPSHGVVIECGSTEVWGAISALRSDEITSFSIITMEPSNSPDFIYTFRRSRSWPEAVKFFAKRDAELRRLQMEYADQAMARIHPAGVQS